jgi:hypothetical protein
MAKVSPQIKDIDSAIGLEQEPLTFLPRVSAPFTTVVNRAPVVNFAADGLPKFGVERIMTQGIVEVQGEVGPNGERVWKPINDVHNAVRFYGPWTNPIDVNGQRPQGSSGAVCEITFYGTGLNLLRYNDSSNRTFSYTVNGGSSTNVTGAWADTILARSYSSNIVFPIISGLTLGLHTVQLTSSSNAFGVFGYEVLNTSASIFLPQTTSYIGGRRLFQNSTGTMSPTTGFESGTLGTRGGHVLVYQKADGTIAKAVTPTNAAAAFLSSADHTNEEEIRRYFPREFGAGRGDDFSSLTASASNRAFTLDDGTTTLVGSNALINDRFAIGYEYLNTSATGDYVTLTFVGTGLDLDVVPSTAAATLSIAIDGSAVSGSVTFSTANVRTIRKICSGLPYGTHTVKINWTTNAVGINSFIVYGPKTPTLPAGAVALADYFVMGDSTAISTAAIDSVTSGALRKYCAREFIYSGTWAITAVSPSTFQSGLNFQSTTNGGFWEYSFFGTGFEVRTIFENAQTMALTISVNGSSNLSGFTTQFAQQSTGLSFTASPTATISGTSSAVGVGVLRVTGLSLGRHTVRITSGNTGRWYADSFDIITPIHSPKINQPGDLQNTLPVGSCAIGDMRKFSAAAVKPLTNWAQAIGVTSAPTTTSTSYVPLPDMSLTLKTSGNPVFITFDALVTNNTVGQTTDFFIYVNGLQIPNLRQAMPAASGYRSVVSFAMIQPLAAGFHKIDVYWSVSAGTGTAIGTNRTLTAREL